MGSETRNRAGRLPARTVCRVRLGHRRAGRLCLNGNREGAGRSIVGGSEMGKVSDLARELRNHAVDDHTRGCGGRTYSCECGYDSKTERLLRAAAHREQLEATLKGMREALDREDEQK